MDVDTAHVTLFVFVVRYWAGTASNPWECCFAWNASPLCGMKCDRIRMNVGAFCVFLRFLTTSAGGEQGRISRRLASPRLQCSRKPSDHGQSVCCRLVEARWSRWPVPELDTSL